MSNTEPSKATPTPTALPVATAAPMEKQIMELLSKVSKLEAKVDTKVTALPQENPKDIDWTKITEKQVFDLQFSIPVIEHELPDYMNIHLKDNNYVARWVHKLPRHLGAMLSSGYAYVTAEDWDPNKPKVLQFDGEGHLSYDDVIALKVHKSRYFGALRRTHLKSTQVNNVSGYNKVKGNINNAIQNNPRMESAIGRGAMSFYGESVESNIEQFSI